MTLLLVCPTFVYRRHGTFDHRCTAYDGMNDDDQHFDQEGNFEMRFRGFVAEPGENPSYRFTRK